MQNTNCPVCGYQLDFLPWKDKSPADEICPSCGIQFGYDDAAGGDITKRRLIYKEWRDNWIKEGMHWFSKRPQPLDWDPIEQLKKLHE